jgi:K+-transporting ATPase KdpF subunit
MPVVGGMPERVRRSAVNLEYLLTGLVALGIAIYLAVALLRPDKF